MERTKKISSSRNGLAKICILALLLLLSLHATQISYAPVAMRRRNVLERIENKIDKVFNRVAPPSAPLQQQQYGHTPQQQQQQQYGQYNTTTPQVPSHPSSLTPPVPIATRPQSTEVLSPPTSTTTAMTAPPAYDYLDQPYWNASFLKESPVAIEWDYDMGGGGWGNAELQTYTSSSQNAFYTDSNTLVIQARANSTAEKEHERYTSARLLSKQRLKRYRGYVHIRLRAPSAKGVWPAVWMLPEAPFSWPQDGEVDIFEAWNGLLENHSCLHWGNYADEDHKQRHRTVDTNMPDIAEYHDYGFAWEQPQDVNEQGGRMLYYVDGKTVMRAEKPAGTRRFEDWRLLLNVAMGGFVCNQQVPADGEYSLEISSIAMQDKPQGGWSGFNRDWYAAPEGKPL